MHFGQGKWMESITYVHATYMNIIKHITYIYICIHTKIVAIVIVRSTSKNYIVYRACNKVQE